MDPPGLQVLLLQWISVPISLLLNPHFPGQAHFLVWDAFLSLKFEPSPQTPKAESDQLMIHEPKSTSYSIWLTLFFNWKKILFIANILNLRVFTQKSGLLLKCWIIHKMGILAAKGWTQMLLTLDGTQAFRSPPSLPQSPPGPAQPLLVVECVSPLAHIWLKPSLLP